VCGRVLALAGLVGPRTVFARGAILAWPLFA
jgi:hypothetical protein